MRYGLLIIFVLIMIGLVGCEGSSESKGLTTTSEQVKIVPLTEVAVKSSDKLIILKRIGLKNQYEEHKEISDEKSVSAVKSILHKGEWKKTKMLMTRPADYRAYFQPTDGSEAKAVLYEVWFTNGMAEIYISGTHSYKQIPREDSDTLSAIVK